MQGSPSSPTDLGLVPRREAKEPVCIPEGVIDARNVVDDSPEIISDSESDVVEGELGVDACRISISVESNVVESG